MKTPARRRWFAATALAALVTCALAATGLFAPCHQSEVPMSCCPDSSQASTAGPQSALLAHDVLTAQVAMLQAMAFAVAPPTAAMPVLGHQRDVYLRLSTLLI